MPKIKLKVDALDAHYLISLALLAKPRRQLLKSVVGLSIDNVLVTLSSDQVKELVDNAVEDAIIKIGKFRGNRDDLDDEQKLSNLQFNSPMYTRLSAGLTDILRQYNNGNGDVSRADIVAAETVGKVKKLVTDKLPA